LTLINPKNRLITATEVRSALKTTFVKEGFVRTGTITSWTNTEVTLLVGFTTAYNRLFVDVGFWLNSYPGQVALKVEKSHIYGRLEWLFPELRPEILDAGECTEERQWNNAFEIFAGHLHSSIVPSLKDLANEAAVTESFVNGALLRFGMPPEIRNYLKSRIN
jgi:hypothetical protein